MPNRKLILGIMVVATSLVSAQNPLPNSAQEYLKTVSTTYADATVEELSEFQKKITGRVDPETYAAAYLFGVKRNASKLLDTAQSSSLIKLIDDSSTRQKQWHDERNLLRCHYERLLWAAAANGMQFKECEKRLREVMSLRMAWTLQEEMNRWVTTRQFWAVLKAPQQQAIIAGDWKKYVKLNKGHTRGDFLKKKLVRSLGKPKDEAEFERLNADWSKNRSPRHAAYLQTRDDAILVGFHFDHSNEGLMHRAIRKQNAAYSTLYLGEAEAMLRIIHSCYPNSRQKCQQQADQLWAEAQKKFTSSDPKLVSMLQTATLAEK